MAFGNRKGVTLDASVEAKDLFAPAFGDLIAEVPADKLDGLTIDYTVIGEVTEEQNFEYKDTKIALADAQKAWESTLESVFATNSKAEGQDEKIDTGLFDTKEVHMRFQRFSYCNLCTYSKRNYHYLLCNFYCINLSTMLI